MVTAELLYTAFSGIVASHKAGVSFQHDTNKILDRSPDVKFPACFWILPTAGLFKPGEAEVYFDSYTITMLFREQTASDRTALEMLHAHARMEVIAKHAFIRFHDLYIADDTTIEGQVLDLELIGAPTFVPVYDEETSMLTGVGLEFTVRTLNAPVCVDNFFN